MRFGHEVTGSFCHLPLGQPACNPASTEGSGCGSWRSSVGHAAGGSRETPTEAWHCGKRKLFNPLSGVGVAYKGPLLSITLKGHNSHSPCANHSELLSTRF